MYFVQFVQSFIIAIQLLQTRQNLTIRLSILEARRFSQSAITFSRGGEMYASVKQVNPFSRASERLLAIFNVGSIRGIKGVGRQFAKQI